MWCGVADWIDPNGGDKSDAVVAYCDHHTNGGGWTLVAAQRDGSIGFPAWQAGVQSSYEQPWDTTQVSTGATSYAMGLQAAALAVQEARVAATSNTAAVHVALNLPAPGSLLSADMFNDDLSALPLHVTDDTTIPLCDAADAQRVWCAAHGGSIDWALGLVCSADSVNATGLDAGACTAAEVAPPGTADVAALSGFDHVALFVRGNSAATSKVSAAADINLELRLQAFAKGETPLCGGLRLGQSKARAALSCAHILADSAACSAGPADACSRSCRTPASGALRSAPRAAS